MPKPDSTVMTIVTAAAAAIGVALIVHNSSGQHAAARMALAAANQAAVQPPAPRPLWSASAPGRVEPRGGEVRISAQATGKIADVLVRMNDRVVQGDLLLRLDDEEALARLAAAEAEAAVRRRERDGETVGRLAMDRRNADDAVAVAERALFQARVELDRVLVARRTGLASEEEAANARAAVTASRDKLEAERMALGRVQATVGMPLATRLEASLAGARSELSLAEAAIERTRVRAPGDGTVLLLHAKTGETVAPSPEQSLIVLGDVSALRVRAEVEERDVAKIRVGQRAVVRSDARPGIDFAGSVATIAQSLGAPRLANRGPRRPNDVDVLEVLIDLAGLPPLLPGMRVDVYFAPDATVPSQPADKAN
jgi:HlyD family secretion protein